MVKTEVKNGVISVKADYSTIFIRKAKQMGGKWNYKNSTWDFDSEDEKEVKELLLSIYKEDGIIEQERVSVLIDLSCESLAKFCDENSYLIIENLDILDRNSKNSDVRLGTSVIITKGDFKGSAGSAKYPLIGDTNGVTIKVKNMPLQWGMSVLEKFGKEYITIIKNEESTISAQEKIIENPINKKLLFKIEDKLKSLEEENKSKKSIMLTKAELEILINALKNQKE